MRQGIVQVRMFIAVVLVSTALAGQAAPAAAQGFLQQLFGLGSTQPAPQSVPQALSTPGGRPYVLPGPAGSGNFMSRRPLSQDEDDHEPKASGIYRTICVRACDGFYFPISNSVSKKGLYRDGMKCRSQCGDEARVFFLPTKTTEVDGAVDLQGRQYGRTSSAYVYRKTLVAGCQCKPDPWAATEMARHQQYADAEIGKKLAALPTQPTAQDVTAVATDDTAPTKKDDAQTVAEAPVAKLKATAWKTSISRAAPKPPLPTQRATPQLAAAKSSSSFGGGMGLGGGQLTWPGDTPRR